MTPLIVLQASLMLMAAMTAVVMAVAWAEFDRPRHALTWGIAFGLLATTGAIELAAQVGRIGGPAATILVVTLVALAAAVNTVGFRQRAMVRPYAGLLISTALLPPIGAALLGRIAPDHAASAPLDLFAAVMMSVAAMTLVGRRRSERAAQRVAYCGLLVLSFLSAALFAAKIHAMTAGDVADVAWAEPAVLTLLPATITGIGLVAIFLLAADQADQTRRLAATDLLTGLLNRRGFEEAATTLIETARGAGRRVCLAVVDIDWFKAINDSFGHPTGDRVIADFAARLGDRFGRRDLLARLGGEEFAVLMADTDLAAAACAAEIARETVAAGRFDLPDGRTITASFGLAEMGAGATTLRDLLARADRALYEAKSAGRNRVVAFTPGNEPRAGRD